MSEGSFQVLCLAMEPEARPGLLAQAAALSPDQRLGLSLAILGETAEVELERYGGFGAEAVHVVTGGQLQDYSPAIYTQALVRLIESLQPDVVLVAGSQLGLELAGAVSQQLGSGCINDLIEVQSAESSFQAKGSIYSGRAEATYLVKARPLIGTIVPKMVPLEPRGVAKATVRKHEFDLEEPGLQLLEIRAKKVFDRGLERAEVVVDFGQGIKSAEDIEMIEELAELMGAQLACTRPISSEREWMPDFIGLSGKRISPRLCLTVGVAGAVQHMVGLRDTELIAAINSDPEAAIFSQSDYGIVGDLYQVVPAMIDELKARGYPR